MFLKYRMGVVRSGAWLHWDTLLDANLQAIDLQRADLRKADLRGKDLREADLRGADLRGADLLQANLGGANLGGADLREANLEETNLRKVNLQEANLQGANLDLSCFPLWCGMYHAVVDDRFIYQLISHITRLNIKHCCDDVKTAIRTLWPYRNEFCQYQEDVLPIESDAHDAISESTDQPSIPDV